MLIDVLLQVSLVDKELANLAQEREENARRLNTKRANHITTLQQLGMALIGGYGAGRYFWIWQSNNFFWQKMAFLR